jgi:isopentenyl phosphate kinase
MSSDDVVLAMSRGTKVVAKNGLVSYCSVFACMIERGLVKVIYGDVVIRPTHDDVFPSVEF